MPNVPHWRCLIHLKYRDENGPVYVDSEGDCIKTEAGWKIILPTEPFPTLRAQFGDDLVTSVPADYLRFSESLGAYENADTYDVDEEG